ncbi:diadenosine tetraphosphate (Ap4A) HIT family hydrolase [Nitrobacter vulgaris]|jgi:diadenosine tetraphosphate (Ap4A) HIT family hydrolase|uniref:HIT family protein n=1 Tax=Nitrobacter vulgaris TaxID=29421 RepID=UPI002862A7C2|nr:HIT family protein [Nitrobacter vulgaris]MDR6303512.1 diadenosine tetraphosphate (Ap4A) HIT family hydrolase [Nitrobacter vulgaris]
MSEAWSLHPQLEEDTVSISDLPLSRLLLSKDASYPWLILVPRRAGAIEIIDLDRDDRALLMTEIGQASEALKDITGCDKLNVAALGNQVPQLHVHIIARRKGDFAWPRPVWGVAPALAYKAAELEAFLGALRRRTGLGETIVRIPADGT